MGQIKRIAVNTGGGDAPGLNAVIRAVVLSAIRHGWEVYGIRKGYNGLLTPGLPLEERLAPRGGLVRLDSNAVRGITHIGGTILGTSNRGNPFEMPVKLEDGTMTTRDVTDDVVKTFHELELDALIAIGGDGSLSIGRDLHELKGLPVIGVPKTIDNDLQATVVTFGFDTAVSTAVDALDKLHSTAESHERVMVVEVMGRYAGWIALNAGVASTADVILLPEIPFDIDKVCEKVLERERRGRHFSIVVAAEGAVPLGGSFVTTGPKQLGREIQLGGIGKIVADEIAARTGKETRSLVLGHLQRGGTPTAFDRLIALRFGAAAVRLVEQGEFGKMVALDPPTVKAVSLKEATQHLKTVPLDCDTIQTAREIGVSFGD
jgi:ATP-dependent phosphofructokinase / diphosphate-dependent phosphofructokinase